MCIKNPRPLVPSVSPGDAEAVEGTRNGGGDRPGVPLPARTSVEHLLLEKELAEIRVGLDAKGRPAFLLTQKQKAVLIRETAGTREQVEEVFSGLEGAPEPVKSH